MTASDDSPAPRVGPPLINSPAPPFAAATTHGPRSLEDFCGDWLMLFSHPMDFTPVCTTEFVAFARAHERFQDLGCALLGLSVDSHLSHIAWTRAIEERFGVAIPFPIAEDLHKRIATDYGMIHPEASDTSTVRTTFFIDPDGILRAALYYPLTNGRNVEELLRLLAALKVTYEEGVGTPEGWQPGDPVILPPPSTVEDAKRREQEDGAVDWYFCTRPAAEQK